MITVKDANEKEYLFLFELGMIQDGKTVLDNYKKNLSYLNRIKPSTIEAVIIGHVHCDHIGCIPWLYANKKANVRIIAPKYSTNLLKEMWLDSAYINQRDAEYLTWKYEKVYEPIYTEEDVYEALKYVEEYDSNEIHSITDDLSIRYIPAGHILCSQQTEVFIKDNANTKKIVFTSDLGNLITQNNRVFVENFTPITKANIVIGESTYGERSKKNSSKKDLELDIQKIKAVIEQYCIESHHRVLIPTFSLDRTPYIIWILFSLFGKDDSFKVPILIDSPLAIRLLRHYSNILIDTPVKQQYDDMIAWQNLKLIEEPEESKAAMSESGAKIICSSSGMLSAGRSVKWAQNILPKEQDCILFIGYAGKDTLAYRIKNGKSQKTITINGKQVKNKCQIVDLKSFSSHMQRNDLINYYKSFNCEKIYLVHGDAQARIDLKEDLQEAISKCLKTTKVIIPNRSTKIYV